MPARQLRTGTILVEPPSRSVGEVAAYARVSSADQQADVDRQVAGVVEHATAVGLTPSRVSSGLELAAQGRQIMALDDGEVGDDLVADMVEVLTSMCARLYGRRSARRRAQRAVEAAGEASA